MPVIELRDELKAGLRNKDHQHRNGLGLLGLVNLRPSEHGLVAIDPLVEVGKRTGDVWPFPLVFQGSVDLIRAGKDSIDKWTGGAWVQEVELDTDASGAWHFVDYGVDWILLCDNQAVLCRNGHYSIRTTPAVTTGCFLAGHGIFGGFSGEDYDLQFFKEASQYPVPESGMNLRPDQIWYSTPDGNNFFELWGHQSDIDNEDSNATGVVHLPVGTIRQILPLSQFSALVFGDSGAALIQTVVSPDPGPAVKQTWNHIITAGRSAAVATGQGGAIVLDAHGTLWSFDESKGFGELGYKEFLAAVAADTCVLSHNAVDNHIYICGHSSGYHFSGGLCKVTVRPTSFIIDNGAPAAPQYGSATTFLVQTDDFDYFDREMNTLHHIEMGMKDVKGFDLTGDGIYDGVNVMFSARSDFLASWNHTNYIPCNERGEAFGKISGVDFRVTVYGTKGDEAQIDFIRLYFEKGWDDDGSRKTRT